MRERVLLVAAVLLVWPEPRAAQTIQGRVLEADTQGPVSGATVVLRDMTDAERGRVVTRAGGAFRLTAPEGWYALEVSHLAYAAFRSDSLHAGAAETVTLEVRVGRAAIPLDPLIVTARSTSRLLEFHERRTTSAFGDFITQEEIERRGLVRTTDLLRGRAGVGVVAVRARDRTLNRVTMQGAVGACDPVIFLDGVRLSEGITPLDEILVPEVIAGVEIYTSSAGAPSRYADSSGCGSILFWTRTGDDAAGRGGWKRVVIGLGLAIAMILVIR